MMRTPSLGSSFFLSCSLGNRSSSIGSPLVRPSDLEQLFLLVLEGRVDLGFVRVRELVELLLGSGDVVLGGFTIAHRLVEIVARGAPQVADGHLAVLREALHALHHLLATLLGEGRER